MMGGSMMAPLTCAGMEPSISPWVSGNVMALHMCRNGPQHLSLGEQERDGSTHM